MRPRRRAVAPYGHAANDDHQHHHVYHLDDAVVVRPWRDELWHPLLPCAISSMCAVNTPECCEAGFSIFCSDAGGYCCMSDFPACANTGVPACCPADFPVHCRDDVNGGFCCSADFPVCDLIERSCRQ